MSFKNTCNCSIVTMWYVFIIQYHKNSYDIPLLYIYNQTSTQLNDKQIICDVIFNGKNICKIPFILIFFLPNFKWCFCDVKLQIHSNHKIKSISTDPSGGIKHSRQCHVRAPVQCHIKNTCALKCRSAHVVPWKSTCEVPYKSTQHTL